MEQQEEDNLLFNCAIQLVEARGDIDQLYEAIKMIRVELEAIKKRLHQEYENWMYLLEHLKPDMELLDGLRSVISDNILPTLREIENNLEKNKPRQHKDVI